MHLFIWKKIERNDDHHQKWTVECSINSIVRYGWNACRRISCISFKRMSFIFYRCCCWVFVLSMHWASFMCRTIETSYCKSIHSMRLQCREKRKHSFSFVFSLSRKVNENAMNDKIESLNKLISFWTF